MTSRKDQGQYRADKSRVHDFMGVRHIAEAFDQSPAGKARTADLSSPALPAPHVVVDKAAGNTQLEPYCADPLVRKRYALSNSQIFKALVQRDLLLMSRNGFLYM